MHRAGVQCFEDFAAFCIVFRLARDVGMVLGIAEERRAMRIAGAAVDTAVVDEEITFGVLWKNGIFGVCRNIRNVYLFKYMRENFLYPSPLLRAPPPLAGEAGRGTT
jgi:hypothetical protein